MNILIISGFIIVISVIGVYAIIAKEEDNIILFMVFPTIAIIGMLFIIAGINITPTAIDVYRGKTELQITYKGTIPIDSVVVFKNK
jgi:hypothetical protein